LLTRVRIWPIGSWLGKRIFASVSLSTTELGRLSAVALLPFTNGIWRMSNRLPLTKLKRSGALGSPFCITVAPLEAM
jgi:hypothetical protein